MESKMASAADTATATVAVVDEVEFSDAFRMFFSVSSISLAELKVDVVSTADVSADAVVTVVAVDTTLCRALTKDSVVSGSKQSSLSALYDKKKTLTGVFFLCAS